MEPTRNEEERKTKEHMEMRPGGRNEGNGNQLDRDGVIGSGPDKMESFCWWPILRCGVKKADDDDIKAMYLSRMCYMSEIQLQMSIPSATSVYQRV